MAATLSDTVLDVSGDPVPYALCVWTALSDTTAAPQTSYGMADGSGVLSIDIPSGIPVLIEIPCVGIRRYLTPEDGDTITLADALEGERP